MLTTMESYLRRGQRALQRLLMKPWLHTLAMVLACSGGGFFLSAGSLLRHAQPLALGLITALPGWQAVAAGVGSALGYWVFWATAGLQGVVWSAAGGLLGALLTAHVRTRDQPLVLPAITAFLTAVTGLAFQTLLSDQTGVGVYLLRILLGAFSSLVFTQALERRSSPTDWLVESIACLCLAQVSPWVWGNPGYALAGCIAVTGSLPGAVLAGLGLDLAGVGALPMTGVMSLAWILRMVPLERRWVRYCLPAGAYITLALLLGQPRWEPVPALLLGGGIAWLLPPRPEAQPRRGNVGYAQVRLELGAQVLGQTQRLLQEATLPPIDEQAILQRAQERSCAGCSARKTCPERGKLTLAHLSNPLEVDCRKQGRLLPELRRGQSS